MDFGRTILAVAIIRVMSSAVGGRALAEVFSGVPVGGGGEREGESYMNTHHHHHPVLRHVQLGRSSTFDGHQCIDGHGLGVAGKTSDCV